MLPYRCSLRFPPFSTHVEVDEQSSLAFSSSHYLLFQHSSGLEGRREVRGEGLVSDSAASGGPGAAVLA